MSDQDSTAKRPVPPPIVVTHEAGLRFLARVGGHRLILDQPIRGGGDDAGPSPIELLGTALGSCIALYVHQFLMARHIMSEGLRVEVTQHSARNPYRVVRFDVHIILPENVPAFYNPMIEATARVCPAYNTLAGSAEVVITIESSVAVMQS